MLYTEQTFAPRAFHSALQQQTNTVNTLKSPPWACDKGCAEACAERFSALNPPPCFCFAMRTGVHLELEHCFQHGGRCAEKLFGINCSLWLIRLTSYGFPNSPSLPQSFCLGLCIRTSGSCYICRKCWEFKRSSWYLNASEKCISCHLNLHRFVLDEK